MPEILRLKTADFELSIWCNNITKAQQVLENILEKRCSAKSGLETTISFYPALEIITEISAERPEASSVTTTKHVLAAPVFFENTSYQFEWVFSNDVSNAQLTHRSQRINDSLRFAPKSSAMPARLTGTINTANDVGWMRLPLEYCKSGTTIYSDIAFEVLPTKMDMHQDLPAMYKAIDDSFPLWRFSLVEKTQQNAAKGEQRGHFPLMWLAHFNQLRERFEQGLKIISQAPHSRLQSHTTYTKAARLKGRIPYKLGESVKKDLANGQFNQRYGVEKKHLSVDTPENRFIKMVVTRSKKQLAAFEQKLQLDNQMPDQQRLSNTFLNEIHAWQQPLNKLLAQSFLKEVGTYNGHNRESLVLQQKTGYSAVYHVWQDLKFYLDLLANQSSISMKSISEIYEVWCFLTIKNILQNELGFTLKSKNSNRLTLNNLLEYQMQDGSSGAFVFTHRDMTVKLMHEPQYKNTSKPIRSYTVPQEPDIVLEVTLPNAKPFIWIFDAKYRIKSNQDRFGQDQQETDDLGEHKPLPPDLVPDDAINQMHRYRDALVQVNNDGIKSRPVLGAFALYPGCFNQKDDPNLNPYAESIKQVGIGAFALLPSNDGSGQAWLSAFLKEELENITQQYYVSNTLSKFGFNAIPSK